MEELNLKIFAKTVEPEVYDQVYRLMSLDVFRDAKVRIMPDTHAGTGCVIGFTAKMGDKVVPNLVGVDIGCFTKDTKVMLADGRSLNFEQLIEEQNQGKEHFGYSLDSNNHIVISKLQFARKIKTSNVILDVELDNGEHIKCTPDHIFYNIQGNEVEAQNLHPGDKLFPLYLDLAKKSR